MDQLDRKHMAVALALARCGEGYVEPNPMVGCVIAHGEQVVGQGWHQAYGQPHAEIEALHQAGQRARGATAYVTLEPCCHQGKTPPCTDALLAAGLARVVVGTRDPFAHVAGRGLAQLREAGIQVEVGVLEDEAKALVAPYLKRVTKGRPWVLAKWAMTLDGKIATALGESRWISGEAAHHVVHQIRGRVDAVMVGRATAERDDPLLTARPPGPRIATRVVLDSQAALGPESQLARTARDVPVLVAIGPQADPQRCRALEAAGCEVLPCPGTSHAERLGQLLDELGRRAMTNVLVEGGGRLLGSLLDARQIDEVHAFIAPKLLGSQAAPSPLAGTGASELARCPLLVAPQVRRLDEDVYIRGRVEWL